MDYTIVAIISYLFGSVPFGFLLTKSLLKKDIREIGSGNIGATNALRSGNKLIGYLTLLMDVSKAMIPIIYLKYNHPELIFISSLCVFLGHLFPVWLKFKGGKGVATYLGILISINLYLGLVFVIAWIAVILISKYSSLSSLLASATVTIYVFLMNEKNVFFYIIMFILIFYSHRQNIKRLINKEEIKTQIY
tara:strand:- start:2186 stop:2761 length:576 start_codon:yes stop_codon:yes gene_type:complete